MGDDDFKFNNGGIEDNAESSLDDFFQPAESGASEPSIDDFFTEPKPADKGKAGPGLKDLDLGGSDEVPGVETDKKKKPVKPALPSADDDVLAAPLEPEAPPAPAAAADEGPPVPPKKKGSAAKIIIIGGLVFFVLLLGVSGGYLVMKKFFSPKDQTDQPVAKNDVKPDTGKDGPKSDSGKKTDTPKTDTVKTDTVKTDMAKGDKDAVTKDDVAKADKDAVKKDDTAKADKDAVKKDGTAKADKDAVKKDDTAKADKAAVKKDDTAKADKDAVKKDDTAKTDKDAVKKDDVAKADKDSVKKDDTAKADKDAVKKDTDKPLTASVNTRTPPDRKVKVPAGHTPVSSDGGPYSVQVGSYLLEASKPGPLSTLAELGYTEHHFTPEHRRLRLFHVIVGKDLSSEEAAEVKSRLEALGYEAELYAGGVKAYTYGSMAVAKKTQRAIIAAGLKQVFIKTEVKDVTLDQLRVGSFSKGRADKAARDLRRSGFKEAYVVRN